MRRPVISFLLAALPTLAAAQPAAPVPAPAPVAAEAPIAAMAPADAGGTIPCAVNIVRAPDDVRRVIEAWVAAEPSCATTLTLRVVATDGGFFLFAQRSDGRIHERLVPDAQTAGVLVASWIATDASAGGVIAPPPAPAQEAPAIVAPIPAASAAPPALIQSDVRGAVVAPGASGASRWVSAMVLGNREGPTGARIEADLVRHGFGGLSTAVSYTQAGNDQIGRDYFAEVVSQDLRGVLSGTMTLERPTFQLRLGLGLGLLYTRSRYTDMEEGLVITTLRTWSPTGEASLLLTRKFGAKQQWAAALGVVATAIDQRQEPIQTGDGWYGDVGLVRRELQVDAMVGLRRRL